MKDVLENRKYVRTVDQAAAQPDKLAIVIPHDLEARPWCRNETYTFASLDLFTRTLMAGLRAQNLGPGDRILVLFPVSGELYALCTAIYAIGAVAVLIDPGMGAKRIRQALTPHPRRRSSASKHFEVSLAHTRAP